jgi:hypothetical protein
MFKHSGNDFRGYRQKGKTLLTWAPLRFCLFICLLLLSGSLTAQFWPKEITGPKYRIVIYQPQPDTLKNYTLSGIAAFSVTPTGKNEPIFGALFFEGKLDIDRDSGTYRLLSIRLPNIRFAADENNIDLDSMMAFIRDDVSNWRLTGSLYELLSTVEDKGDFADKGSEEFNNNPPKIIFKTKPAVLIIVDGEPILQDIDSTNLKRVINSAFIIFQNKPDKRFYLFGGEDSWFSSMDIKKGWSLTTHLPPDLQKIMEANKENAKNAATVNVADKDSIPEIVVVTEPSELIQTGGEPTYAAIAGTSLLYASNSEDNIFKDIHTQEFFILKSGRWFASKSLDSGWRYVDPLSIPSDFSLIPEGSEKDIVLASVPGTTEAIDALLDTRIPQMATVDRNTAGKDLTVEYDGEPQFETIKGTSLQLAKNASKTVIVSGSKFFVVDNGVWYESTNNTGPWVVSTSRPEEVENIPASSPAYNTKFVNVYDTTAETVTTGYTPGYTNCFATHTVVVYGTGVHYTPWVGTVFMPMPMTWGFNMFWHPWMGWSMGWGMGWGMGMRWGWGMGWGMSMGMGMGMGMTMGFGMGMSMGMRMGWGMGMRGGWGMWGPPMHRPPMHRPPQGGYGSNRPGMGVNNQRPPAGNPNRPGGGNANRPGGNRPDGGGGSGRPGGGEGRPGGGRPGAGQGNYAGNNLYKQAEAGNSGIRSGVQNSRPGNMAVGGQPGKNAGYAQPSTGNRQPGAAAGNNTRPGTNQGVNNRAGGRPNNVYADRGGNVYQRNSTNNQWQQRNNNTWSNTNSANNNRMNSAETNRNRGAQRTNSYQQPSRAPQRSQQQSRPASRPAGGASPRSGGARR